ncbi:unnamed protein product [Clavelina lepadiformis]|uniref:BACK domain-containing protein n=1 Tax=Clavelina lepadiformis TaxID=159417 RepID=A0ABP0G8R0_CLALP
MGDLLQAAETFISKNLVAVLKSSDFLQLGVDDVKAMLKLESDEELIDEEKYRSVVNWTKHGVCDRKEHFSDLFCFIQLDYLSSEFLNDVVRKEELVCNSLECMNLLVASLNSRLCGDQVFKKRKGQFDKILIIGGTDREQSVVKFNTKRKQWSDMPDTNIVRRFPSAVNYNQQIFLMGGSDDDADFLNSIEMLDLNDENPKWDSNFPSMGEKAIFICINIIEWSCLLCWWS